MRAAGARPPTAGALALIGALGLLLAGACSEGPATAPAPAVAPGESTESTEPSGSSERSPRAVSLRIGGVYPETGPLAPLTAPARAAVLLAVDDINAAGGDVTLTVADSATNPAVARDAVDRLLAGGADAITGPAASGIVQAVLPTLFEQRIPQCSPSAQDPALSTQENAAYFFRTMPPYQAVASTVADVVAGDGATRVAIMVRADEAGVASASRIAALLAEHGVGSEAFVYDPADFTFDTEAAAVAAYGPDAVVVAGFFVDGAGIIRYLLEEGLGAEMMYGTDTTLHPGLWRFVDPTDPDVLNGMTFIGAAGHEEFNQRLGATTEGHVSLAGQAYDCIILLALAAEAAGSVDGDAMLAAFGQLTRGGTECRSYAECTALIAEGRDIDYVGASGPLDFNDVGDPTVGTLGAFRFNDGRIDVVRTFELDLTGFYGPPALSPAVPGPVEFPRDELPHDNLLEWWYYNGNLRDPDGGRYGFHFVIFQVRDPQLGGVTYIAHAAITDLARDRREEALRVAIGEQPHLGDAFAFEVGGWTLDGTTGEHEFTATTDSYTFAVRMAAVKPVSLHDEDGFLAGPDGDGWTYYYSWPRMSLTGTLTVDGETLAVTGDSWMDHQWGDFGVPGPPAGWQWFGVQLDDGSEIMVAESRDAAGATTLTGSVIRSDGTTENVPPDGMSIERLAEWTSPHTGAVYPAGWRISMPDYGIDATLTPAVADQEFTLAFPASTIYWEGLLNTEATVDGVAVGGLGYAELVGFVDPWALLER